MKLSGEIYLGHCGATFRWQASYNAEHSEVTRVRIERRRGSDDEWCEVPNMTFKDGFRLGVLAAIRSEQQLALL